MSSSPTRKKSSRTPKRKPTQRTTSRASQAGGENENRQKLIQLVVADMRRVKRIRLADAILRYYGLHLVTTTESMAPYLPSLLSHCPPSPSHEIVGLLVKRPAGSGWLR
jgi:hypothetical protein